MRYLLALGKKVGKRGRPLPVKMLTDSVPGKFYHLNIETTGISDEKAVASLLINKLNEKFKAKVVWIKVEGNNIELQISGSPFVWAVLIPFIPTILAVIGISVVLVAVYSIISAIPTWAWALLIIGSVLAVFGPGIARTLVPEIEVEERKRIARRR